MFKDSTPLSTVHRLKVHHLLLQDNQGWNIPQINLLFEPSTARCIKGIELPHNLEVNDIQYWPFTYSGTYTTKSGYNTLLQQKNKIYSMTSSLNVKFFRTLWSLNIMPKWKLFLWKLWHNGLATTDNLHHRGITPSGECPICLHDREDTQHLFQQCPLATEAWEHGSLHALVYNTQHLPTKDWICHCLGKLSKANGVTDSVIIEYIGTLWAIWKLRNAQVFRHQRPTPASIAIQLTENLNLHNIFVQKRHDHTWNSLDPPMPQGFDIVNTGQHTVPNQPIFLQIAGYKHKLKGMGGLAWMEGRGNQVSHQQHGSFCYSSSINSMVATACQYACTWAVSNNHGHICILTNSQDLIYSLRTTNSGPIETKWTIGNILRTAKLLTTCQVIRVPRQQIEGAHHLAKWWCHSNRSLSLSY